jgi:hypothetical protein
MDIEACKNEERLNHQETRTVAVPQIQLLPNGEIPDSKNTLRSFERNSYLQAPVLVKTRANATDATEATDYLVEETVVNTDQLKIQF